MAAAGVSLALENYEAYATEELGALVEESAIQSRHLSGSDHLFGALESADSILDHLAELTINIHLKEFVVERLPHLMDSPCGSTHRPRQLPLETIFSRA